MCFANARRGLGLNVLLVAVLAGCSRTGTVTGVVSYEAEPIKNGSIVFLPADGKGPAAGGKIIDGAFRVDQVTPGKKTVQITAGAAGGGSIPNPEDLAKGPPRTKPSLPTGGMPANAVGNNSEVDIKSGAQELNFELKKPAKKGR